MKVLMRCLIITKTNENFMNHLGNDSQLKVKLENYASFLFLFFVFVKYFLRNANFIQHKKIKAVIKKC